MVLQIQNQYLGSGIEHNLGHKWKHVEASSPESHVLHPAVEHLWHEEVPVEPELEPVALPELPVACGARAAGLGDPGLDATAAVAGNHDDGVEEAVGDGAQDGACEEFSGQHDVA